MVWNDWIKAAGVRHLEGELNRRGIVVVKANDYVRIGTASLDKIYTRTQFTRQAECVCRDHDAGSGRTAGDGTRPQHAPDHQTTMTEIDRAGMELLALAKQALAERDEWRRKADRYASEVTELQLRLSRLSAPRATSSAAGPPTHDRFLQVKRLLARELHPDSVPGSMEKAVRGEMFKKIWPLLEKIEAA